jgi:hypothetical protein
MHVVRHQAPGPHLDLGGAAMGGEQIVIERIVMVAEDGSGPSTSSSTSFGSPKALIIAARIDDFPSLAQW